MVLPSLSRQSDFFMKCFMFADTQRHADEAAKAVKVTYKEQKPLILTIDEAIAAKSFFDPQAKTLTKGDAAGKIPIFQTIVSSAGSAIK